MCVPAGSSSTASRTTSGAAAGATDIRRTIVTPIVATPPTINTPIATTATINHRIRPSTRPAIRSI